MTNITVTNWILGERRKERDALKLSEWNMDSSVISQCDENWLKVGGKTLKWVYDGGGYISPLYFLFNYII